MMFLEYMSYQRIACHIILVANAACRAGVVPVPVTASRGDIVSGVKTSLITNHDALGLVSARYAHI